MAAPRAPAGTSPCELVSPRERVLYRLMLFVSLAVYGGLAAGGPDHPGIAASIVTYGPDFLALGSTGTRTGTEDAFGAMRCGCPSASFPLVQRLTVAHARKLGLTQVPSIYVIQSGGLLNAFATRFLGRDFVIL
jgi:hypothetical protein